MSKKKRSDLSLMVRGEVEGVPVDEWDYLWTTKDEIQKNKEKGYVFLNEVKTPH